MSEVRSSIGSNELRALVRQRGLTQSKIAKELGISQSQVSRVLSGRSCKRSPAMHKICSLVEAHGSSARPETMLMDAIAFTWDGTQRHATALAAVIRSLRDLTSDGQ